MSVPSVTQWHEYIAFWMGAISQYFYEIYLEVNEWVWPFNNIAWLFQWLYTAFLWLENYFTRMSEWVFWANDWIPQILTISDISRIWGEYFTKAIDAWNWIQNAWDNLLSNINAWWDEQSLTVKGWIDELKVLLEPQIAWVNYKIDTLALQWGEFRRKIPTVDEIIAWFSDWWAKILSPLTSWWNERLLDVDRLINDTLKIWFPFYDTLVELWDTIMAFFVSPLDWLLDQFTDWFLGSE